MNEPSDTPEGEPSEHPSESVLAAYLDGELSVDERAQVELHFDQCMACRRALADTVDVLDTTDATPALSTVPSSTSQRRRYISRISVLTAIAASLAAVVVLQRRPGGEDITGRTRDAGRNTTDERIPQLMAVTPGDGSANVSDPRLFIWRSADVDRYSFRLLAEDGVPIWSRETSDTTITLPPDVRLDRGRSYFWRVDALAAGIVASTRAQRFTVSR